VPDLAQRILGAVALILSAPLMIGLALIVKLDSPGPALYRAVRVGVGGRTFQCLKLRTMAWHPGGGGSAITIDDDGRITRVGRVVRRLRLDELPQLINVARGEMNLVGPRPEDPRFVDFDDPLHRRVFMAKPGITGLAQLTFIDEARWLGSDPAEADRRYRESVLPQKLAIDARYLRDRSWRGDAWILFRTATAVVGRAPTVDGQPPGPRA
jgi:lipopolysaccharide/colanic/teichoic acid biosynthesis glycosyltransferase